MDQRAWKGIMVKLQNVVIPFLRLHTQLYSSTIAAWSLDVWQVSLSGWSQAHHLQPDEVPEVQAYDVVEVSAVSYALFPRCIDCLREFHPGTMAFCPGKHSTCAECLFQLAVAQGAQGEVAPKCEHFSGCGLPFEPVGLQGVPLAQLLAAFEPHENGAPLLQVTEKNHSDDIVNEGDGEREAVHNVDAHGLTEELHVLGSDDDREERLYAAQIIQEHIDRCVDKIKQNRSRAPPDDDPEVLNAQVKGKDDTSTLSSSEAEYDTENDTDADAQHRSISEALTQRRQYQRGLHVALLGEGPSRLAGPSGSISAPASPAKGFRAAERGQSTRVPKANRSATGFRFKKPEPILGPVYAELYAAVVKTRKARDKVQQKLAQAELKVRTGALGWTQGRLDLVIAEWSAAQDAVVAAGMALDQHRKGL